ncbi:protein of unknown function [Azospirillum baldaniorum]|uniref:Uncharacterized protein n=1 Tax=Azospirillum baldaniorum TaxID=1064539 RepID=A0A9P1NLE5_9PROT|nr:protein of unknown function [Azospirillum baldaniorum]
MVKGADPQRAHTPPREERFKAPCRDQFDERAGARRPESRLSRGCRSCRVQCASPRRTWNC